MTSISSCELRLVPRRYFVAVLVLMAESDQILRLRPGGLDIQQTDLLRAAAGKSFILRYITASFSPQSGGTRTQQLRHLRGVFPPVLPGIDLLEWVYQQPQRFRLQLSFAKVYASESLWGFRGVGLS